jgi:transcription initiation factor TFIIIB Brf1 subunit/transcription initiation factor TFIIB
MYGHNRCPRCGGHRIYRQSPRGIVVVCAGCGLMTTEPAFPAAPNVTTDCAQASVHRRRQIWTQESPVCRPPLTPMKHQ